MKCIVVLIGLGVATVLANAGAGSSESPVGTWEVKKPDGFAFFTFEDGGTVTGYGGGRRSFGLFNATGAWVVASGTITGQLVDLAGNIPAPFKGKATATRLKLRLSIATGRVTLTGKPATDLPDVAGHWTGTAKQHGVVAAEVLDISATARPGVFDVAGTSGDSIVAGQLLLSSKSKGFAYLTETNGPVSLAGKFDTINGAAKLSGIDTNRQAVRIKLTRP